MNYLFICLVAFVAFATIECESYVGYKLLYVYPETDEHVKLISKFEDNPDFDVWNNAKGIKPRVDVVLSPTAFLAYKQIFELYNIKFEVIDENIQNKIDEQERSNMVAKQRNQRNIVGTFASYPDIQDFLEEIADDNKRDGIDTEVIGKSHENRNLKVITFKIGKPSKKIWIDCGIHARERISVAFCIYFIDYLNKNIKTQEVKDLLSYYEINILPLVNPDGYEYARTTSSLWRKNRRRNSGSTCIGVDLNRNYGFKWMLGGASNNPCSDTFAGPLADSEPETIAIEKYIQKNTADYDAFITVHTYGLWWFTPWGYSTSELPADYADLLEKVKIGTAAIKAVYNTNYVVGSSAQVLYVAAGGSDDWAKSVGIKHSTTMELRPGQNGVDSNYGFLLPADRIPQVGAETTAGVMAYLKAVKAQSMGK